MNTFKTTNLESHEVDEFREKSLSSVEVRGDRKSEQSCNCQVRWVLGVEASPPRRSCPAPGADLRPQTTPRRTRRQLGHRRPTGRRFIQRRKRTSCSHTHGRRGTLERSCDVEKRVVKEHSAGHQASRTGQHSCTCWNKSRRCCSGDVSEEGGIGRDRLRRSESGRCVASWVRRVSLRFLLPRPHSLPQKRPRFMIYWVALWDISPHQ